MKKLIGHSALLIVAFTGACGQQQSGANAAMEMAKPASVSAEGATAAYDAQMSPPPPMVERKTSMSVDPTNPSEPPAPNPPTGAPATTTALMLAYSYSATLVVPADNVTKVMKAHEQKCITAGPALCQVVSAASQKDGDSVTANLALRAVPAWLGTFRTGLEQDAKTADGKLEAQGVTSEDLTRSITDSEARLRAMKALRTRIEALIASRPGKLSDLLEAEQELARVQGEIDSYESNLSVMRARVTMSTMDMTYQSRPIAVGGGTFSPLGQAITGFLGVMASSLAALITFLAAILPFILVIGPILYYGFKWRTKQVRAKAQLKADQAVS